MEKYKKAFPHKHAILIVVHAESAPQTLRNVDVAFKQGAHGVFLINHHIGWSTLLDCYEYVREMYASKWIGLNFLDLTPGEALKKLPKFANGLWIDDGGIREDHNGRETFGAGLLRDEIHKLTWDGLLFGGVAFKHQRPVESPRQVAKLAAPFMDVITTSGDRTGVAADIDKIKALRLGAGEHPLAIASGITPGNVEKYMPYTNCFLVSTGVSKSYTELDPRRVRMLVEAVSA